MYEIDDDETLRQRARRDDSRSTQDFTRCRFCEGFWHGLPKHFPTGETCHGSHEGSAGKTLT
jgi:hypothetical protein